MRMTIRLIAALGCGCLCLPAQATILTFGQGSFAPIDQNYGDNVATLPNHGGFVYGNDGSPTPNVALSYVNTSWGTSGAGIPGVTYPSSGQTAGTSWSYTFTAAPGYYAVLDSIDYGHLLSGAITTYPTVSYAVTGGTPAVFAGTITPNTALSNLQTLDLGGVYGQSLTLTFTVTVPRVGGSDGLGFDNLIFTQAAVPEAGSLSLLATGGMGMIVIRRRQFAGWRNRV